MALLYPEQNSNSLGGPARPYALCGTVSWVFICRHFPLDYRAPVWLCSREHLHMCISLFLKTPTPSPTNVTNITPCASSAQCMMRCLSSQEDGARAISTLCISRQCLASSSCATKTRVKRDSRIPAVQGPSDVRREVVLGRPGTMFRTLFPNKMRARPERHKQNKREMERVNTNIHPNILN